MLRNMAMVMERLVRVVVANELMRKEIEWLRKEKRDFDGDGAGGSRNDMSSTYVPVEIEAVQHIVNERAKIEIGGRTMFIFGQVKLTESKWWMGWYESEGTKWQKFCFKEVWQL
jgi:hypothetical protein